MSLKLTLSDKGDNLDVIFDGPDEVDTFADHAVRLYCVLNPAYQGRDDLMVQIDHSIFCEISGEIDLFVSRARFATRPKRDGASPRWGRWHDLEVSRIE